MELERSWKLLLVHLQPVCCWAPVYHSTGSPNGGSLEGVQQSVETQLFIHTVQEQ